MLKQTFIAAAVLIAAISQMIPSWGNMTADSLDMGAPSYNGALAITEKSNVTAVADTVPFYIGNRSSSSLVTVRFSSTSAGGATLQYSVAAGEATVAFIPAGTYAISGNALGAYTYSFSVNCGLSSFGNSFSFTDVDVSILSCAEIIVTNE